MIRITEPLNYFKEPWYIEWVLREFAKNFKECADVEKAQKFAMRDLKRIMNEATDIGTEVDAIIKANPMECKATHKRIEVNQCLVAYEKWRKVYEPKSIVPCERFNINVGEDISGEPDIIVDGVLVDIKCSARISKGYWLQVNAYAHLKEDFKGNKVGILRLDKETASYEYVVKDYDPNLVAVWMGLMRAYIYFKGEENGGVDVREGEIKEGMA